MKRLAAAAVIAAAFAVVTTRAQTGSLLLAVIRGDKAGPVLGLIDPVAGAFLAKVPLAGDPHIVDVTTDGRFAFVVNSDAISVIDLAARKEVRRVPTGAGSKPRDLRVVDRKVYFTIEGFKSIGRYDPARNGIDWTLGLGYRGPRTLAVSRDGDSIVGANPSSNNVSIVTNVLKGPAGWDVTHVPVGRQPEGVDISPDGREAWVSNEAAGGVSIIDLARKAVRQHVDLKTTHVNRLRFMPRGDLVLVVNRHAAEVVVVEVSSRTAIKRIPIPDSAPIDEQNRDRVYDLALSSNGVRAYVSVNGPPGRSYIGVVETGPLALTRRIATGATADDLAFVVMK